MDTLEQIRLATLGIAMSQATAAARAGIAIIMPSVIAKTAEQFAKFVEGGDLDTIFAEERKRDDDDSSADDPTEGEGNE